MSFYDVIWVMAGLLALWVCFWLLERRVNKAIKNASINFTNFATALTRLAKGEVGIVSATKLSQIDATRTDTTWILRAIIRLLQKPKITVEERHELLKTLDRYTIVFGSPKLAHKDAELNACINFWAKHKNCLTPIVAKRRGRNK